ncbi:molybdopterin-binding protein [Sulfurimonas hongkongensis]|uniref:Molybdopterin-binding protein n=1 Tax=Sulfurimonas hongkongensis TaxID=1172190 RepID=T0KFF5_9BACT|nr:molybdopterin-binding protein [Sulfurimonas hongkongensis]EQB35489.1 molybdopterin-binding protein [Sulfurimonas hongkongensis]
MNFYTLIIGTEILNARREDKHFKFVRDELKKYGHELFATFIVRDELKLLQNCFELIKSDKESVMFSFGGIGCTPDDLTREIAADIFTSKPVVRHKEFEKDILDRFGERAYPHRVHMADLPENSKLLFNPVNNMSGFSLEDRFFFTPGFPEMAHPMISDVISKFFSKSALKYRLTLLAKTSEETLISQMSLIPAHIELSSLPIFIDKKPNVELSLSGYDENEVREYFTMFEEELKKHNIEYRLL